MASVAAPRAAQQRRPVSIGRMLNRVLFYLLIAVILLYIIFPFYWAIVTSFKPSGQLSETPVNYWPRTFTTENYQSVLANPDFLRALRNSAIVSISTVLISLLIGSLAAYALGRLPFRGKNFVLYTVLAMSMFPAIAVLGSLYQMIVAVGLYNRIPALILSYLTFTLPFTVWVLTNFFRAMPGELEEAAFVDGATPMQTFRMVLLPLAAPGLVTTGLLAFIAAWNEYLFALTFTQDYAARTVPVQLRHSAGARNSSCPMRTGWRQPLL